MAPEKANRLAGALSITLSIIFIILIILLFILLIVPQLIINITNFIQSLPELIKHAQDYIDGFLKRTNLLNSPYITNLIREVEGYLNTSNLIPNLTSTVTNVSTGIYSVFRSLFNFLIGLIVAVYCLDRRKVFALQAKKLIFALFKPEVAETILEHTREANHIFLGFMVGKLIDSLIIGIICFVGVLILQIPNPVLVAVIIGVTNIIPFFGPFLGAIPCIILTFLISPIKSLYLLIFIFLLQQFDGNILGPKILGDITGVTSFWVLFSILLFGGLFGIVGMIIAVPLFGVFYNLVREFINSRLKKKDLPTKAYYYEDPKELIKEEK